MITVVNKAFGKGQAALLVQEHSQSLQNRTVLNCKSGDGICIDPAQLDIEGFDCACIDDLADASEEKIHAALCEHPDICCDWKANECSPKLLSTDIETLSAPASLDESLSGKRTCR